MAISSINKSIGKGFDYTVRKTFAKALENGQKNPAKYAALMMVVSLVSKDAVNCVFYTVQSANNKRIPEDKRKFVASMDLMNGIINVVGQIASFAIVERILTPKMKAKCTGILKDKDDKVAEIRSDRTLSNDNILGTFNKALKDLEPEAKKLGIDIKNTDFSKYSKKAIERLGSGGPKAKAMETGIGLIIGILATNALIKRTITPLFATPLAGWFVRSFWGEKAGKGKSRDAKTVEKPEVKPEVKTEKVTEAKSAEQSKKPIDVKA